ncbi:hypothetical protein HII36_41855 [Nonomuraea sp. NN258]|uniref:hypothetical protein n=1 Tax=Nonomuraea antri TaxID=2730852 RepID=UPI0015695414|nr:hypothetical protein [Nonomuraea antri]NRQ38329.1 hypothetical protein [Nonomuraea antri]
MSCVQCGHPHPTLIRRPLRPARYSCRSCGALYRPGPTPDGDEPAGADPLSAYLTEPMLRWVRAQPAIGPDAPDRETISRWYKEFDAFVAKAKSSAAARAAFEQVVRLPPERLPAKPPAFAKVCAVLHATCYDAELAAARLPGADRAYVAERVAGVRRWLAGPGRDTTWPAAPAVPGPGAEAVRELLSLWPDFPPERVATLFVALFGVADGPSLPGVRERFGDDGIREALLAHLATGERPLRQAVTRALEET